MGGSEKERERGEGGGRRRKGERKGIFRLNISILPLTTCAAWR